RYLLNGVTLDDGQDCLGAGLIDGNLESVRKLSLDQVAWHGGTPWFGHRSFVGHDSRARAAADRQIHPYCGCRTPKLRYIAASLPRLRHSRGITSRESPAHHRRVARRGAKEGVALAVDQPRGAEFHGVALAAA